MSKPKIAVIIGSTRDSRFADIPAQWILAQAKARTDMDVELVDLKSFDLPLFKYDVVIVPAGILSVAEELLRNPIYATGIGLLFYGMQRTLAICNVPESSLVRESELVTLLKDILHCSDVFATFRPDLHARLLDFGRRLKAQEPRDDFPDDYEV